MTALQTLESGPAGVKGFRAAWPVALAVLMACGFGGCVRKPEVRLRDIRVDRLTFQSLELVCDFEIYNPNLFAAKLRSLDWSVTSGDETLAAGEVPPPIPTVPARGTATVPVAVGLDLKTIGRLVRRYRQGQDIPYRLEVRPVFDIIGIGLPVPVYHTGRVPRLQAPRWKLQGVKLQKGVSAKLLVTFEVTNPGELGLSLSGVAGTLTLGGQPIIEVSGTTLTELPGGKTAELVVPVQIHALNMLPAITKALADREGLRFEGEFHLQTPLSLRNMLLGKP